MKKRNFVVTLLLLIGLIMIPQLGNAGMVPLSDDQLGNIAGQGGLSIQIESLNWNTAIETLAYGDGDGLGKGTGTGAGYISLCGIVFKGAARFDTPLTIDVATVGDGTGRVGLTSLNMTMTGMTLRVDRFSVDAIRLGNQPGTGSSLGSLYMSNMVASVTGKVQISTTH